MPRGLLMHAVECCGHNFLCGPPNIGMLAWACLHGVSAHAIPRPASEVMAAVQQATPSLAEQLCMAGWRLLPNVASALLDHHALQYAPGSFTRLQACMWLVAAVLAGKSFGTGESSERAMEQLKPLQWARQYVHADAGMLARGLISTDAAPKWLDLLDAVTW